MRLLWHLELYKTFKKNLSRKSSKGVEILSSKTVEIFMSEARSRSATRGFILRVLGGKSVPVLLSDARLKHIKTKTGSAISHRE